MVKNTNMIKRAIAFLIVAALVPAGAALAQTKVKPGMNFFSLEQDIEIGREAAREVEQKMPMLDDREVGRYISNLGMKLARRSDYPDLPWRFKVVNAREVNAFALPGGFIYVNRGLIETAETEGQLAGVLAHEISHVTLRHSTNQLSKAMLAQAPLAALGGLVGGGVVGQLSQLGIAMGVNLAFMKFSRSAETQADIVGTQLMVRAGYDPNEMVRMFELLERQRKREPSKFEQWFSSHPIPEKRSERIRQEIALLKPRGELIQSTEAFDSIRARLRGMPAAPKGQPQPAAEEQPRGNPPRPSTDFRLYSHSRGLFSIFYPANWRVAGESGSGALLAPEGGIVRIGNQEQIVYGVLINIFEPHRRRGARAAMSLEDAVDELIDALMRGNPHLSEVSMRRRDRLAGAPAITTTLSGTPPTGRPEAVWLAARWYDDNLLYLLLIAPQDEFRAYEPTFRAMLRSLEVG